MGFWFQGDQFSIWPESDTKSDPAIKGLIHDYDNETQCGEQRGTHQLNSVL